MGYGVLCALPGARACWPPSPTRRESVVADLIPASGDQDHAAWPSANARSSAPKRLRAVAATAPRLHVRDDRETHLCTRRDAADNASDLGVASSHFPKIGICVLRQIGAK